MRPSGSHFLVLRKFVCLPTRLRSLRFDGFTFIDPPHLCLYTAHFTTSDSELRHIKQCRAFEHATQQTSM